MISGIQIIDKTLATKRLEVCRYLVDVCPGTTGKPAEVGQRC